MDKIIIWKRFSNAPYAVFNALHRVVNIGVVSASIIACADLKAQTRTDIETADQGVIQKELNDVTIVAEQRPNAPDLTAIRCRYINKYELTNTATQCVNDALKTNSDIDVRQRGAFGIQTDISIRGASNEQTAFLLNGIDISSPQTGHLSADFPISTNAIESLQILPSETSVNAITCRDTTDKIDLQLVAGQYGMANANLLINRQLQRVRHFGNANYSRSDGATENSNFDQTKLFYSGNYSAQRLNMQWQAGYSRQSYGANTFYSAAYPNQWEQTNRFLASAQVETQGQIKFSASMAYMRNYDHFQLIRNSSFGENFHRTDVYSVYPKLLCQWHLGYTQIGANLRHEEIVSTNLGRPLDDDSVRIGHRDRYYTKGLSRRIGKMLIEHFFDYERVKINLGTQVFLNSEQKADNQFLPFANIDVNATRALHFNITARKLLRTPTFTDLFYKSPTIEGNRDLKSEKSMIFDVAARYRCRGLKAEVSGYYTHGKSMIDWVMYTETDTYHSTNFKLENRGLNVVCNIYFDEIFGSFPMSLALSYSHIDQRRRDNIVVYKASYALEYLRNKVTAQLIARPVGKLTVSANYRFAERNGSYIVYHNSQSTGELHRYTPYSVVDCKANWSFSDNCDIFVEINNLFDNHYYDYGNVEQPGFWSKIGFRYCFD
ncbi:MAG: TonB-dependent receptor [Bacteroidales bacterium]|nr:TonB-dependent receptor [Bacteroidales bacterium]